MEGAGVREERVLQGAIWLFLAIICAVALLSGCVQFAPATPAVPVVMPPAEPATRPVIVLPDAPWWVPNARRFVEDTNALSH